MIPNLQFLSLNLWFDEDCGFFQLPATVLKVQLPLFNLPEISVCTLYHDFRTKCTSKVWPFVQKNSEPFFLKSCKLTVAFAVFDPPKGEGCCTFTEMTGWLFMENRYSDILFVYIRDQITSNIHINQVWITCSVPVMWCLWFLVTEHIVEVNSIRLMVKDCAMNLPFLFIFALQAICS